MKYCIFSLLIFLTFSISGQVIPVPESNLIHTQVMFEYPSVNNAVNYKIEISQWDSLKKLAVPFLEQFDNTTATLVSGLSYGYEYRWKYRAFDKKEKLIFTSQDYVFYIKKVQEVNPDYQRIRLNQINCKDSLKGLVSFDYCKTIVNRKGLPVCYVPEAPPILNSGFFIRDLRITPGGTITLLSKTDAIEMDLDGNIIWVAPNDGKVSGEQTEFYHHAFFKMDKGNYMILSNKHRKIQSPFDTTNKEIEFGTIIEYDLSGNVAWKWDSQDYLSSKDLFQRNQENKTFAVNPHSNSLDMTKDGNYLYLGFRDISRIIKIEKSSGRVVASFGAKMPSGEAAFANKYFRFQHSSTLLNDGNIAVFNNDSIADPKVTSSIVIFSQPDNKKMSSELIWKFDCKFDSLTNGKSLKTGNVIELPDKNILLNMGTINRTIEISRNDKKIVWDAFTEKWNSKENKWESFPQFRSAYISSLYPCYFTVCINKKVTKKGSITGASMIIYNKGTEPDEYKVITDYGKEKTEIMTQVIMPDHSVTVNIPNSTANDISEIKIISSLDGRRCRMVNFQTGMQESSLNSLPAIRPLSHPNSEDAVAPK